MSNDMTDKIKNSITETIQSVIQESSMVFGAVMVGLGFFLYLEHKRKSIFLDSKKIIITVKKRDCCVQTDSPVQLDADVQTDACVQLDADVQTDACVQLDADVQTDACVKLDENVQTDTVVQIEVEDNELLNECYDNIPMNNTKKITNHFSWFS